MALLQISEPGKSQDPHEKRYYIGIDLGTTNSLVAVIKNGSPSILKEDTNNGLLPSIVTYAGDDVFVGDNKKNNESITFRSIKRFLGKNLEDLKKENFYSPCEYLEENNVLRFKVFEKLVTPVEISSEILKHLKNITNETLKGEIAGCVITVPAYFDDTQRQATKDAASLSGLKVLRLLNEPTAAAIAYGLQSKKISKVMVYDLGGWTFGVSILNLNDGIFKVLSTGGNSSLGGDDFDSLLADYIEKTNGLNLDEQNKYNLYLYAKEIKKNLSDSESIKYNLSKIGLNNQDIILTQKEFNLIIKSLVKKTLKISESVLRDANLTIEGIDEIILVGGSTRTPYVKNMVEDFFNKKPLSNINPDNVVAIGASIQADILSGDSNEELLLLDVIPLSLGI